MDKTRQLNKLFDEWESSKGYVGQFSKDGIVDEARYTNAHKRILFVLKEPMGHCEDIRDHAKDAEEKLRLRRKHRHTTWKNLGRWSYGLLAGSPSFDEMEDAFWKSEALRKIAVMNLKKTPGGTTARPSKIKMFANDNREFIIHEMEIIEPSLVVCCGARLVGPILKDLLPNTKTNHTEGRYESFLWNRIPFVSCFHPNARVQTQMMYSTLMHEVQNLQVVIDKSSTYMDD